MAYEMTAKDLVDLSEDQQVAIMESLVLAIVADHKTNPAETTRFDAELSAIPWKLEPPKVIEHILEIRDRVLAMKDTQEPIALIRRIAERLPDPSVREKVFRAMGSIMSADGTPNLDEKNMLITYARAFGLDGHQIEAIKADLAAAEAAAARTTQSQPAQPARPSPSA